MSTEELRMEEKEVLLSIYDGDGNFKLIADDIYQYKIDCGENKSFLLELRWPEDYPNVAPEVNLDTFFNNKISNSIKESIVDKILHEAKQYLGMSMAYTLFEWAKENGEELMKDYIEHASIMNGEEISSQLASTYIHENDVTKKKMKEKKEQLTKAQKRKLTSKLDETGQRPRGWNWTDVIKHLSQLGSKEQQSETPAQSRF